MNKLQVKFSLFLIILLSLCILCPLYAQTDTEDYGDNKDRNVKSFLTRDRRAQENRGFLAELPKLSRSVDPDTYILGPYDRLLISITGTETRTFDIMVLPEGNVYLPGIGSVRADGISLSEFHTRVSTKALEVFHDIELHSLLLSPRIFKVFVSGEVNDPGMVEVSAVECVTEAVKKAGDVNTHGSSRRVKLLRDGEVIEVDLLKIIIGGELGNNLFLSNGDAIHVPPAQRHVTVHGRIKRGGTYEILPGETVKDVIELAGGMTGEAVRDSILLSRVVSGDSVSTSSVARENFDKKLKDLDIINILDRFSTADRVFVFGAVEKTGRFYITEGEKLSSLLSRVGSFNNSADLRASSIERKNKEHIRIDLTKYMSHDLETDIRLKDGDKLFVPSVNTIVAVGGEVQVPGSFEYQGDLTVAHYVGLAGGPTEKGSMNRIEIYSTDGSVRESSKDARPNRGDVIIVRKSKKRLLGEFVDGVIRLGTVVISVIVLTR
ncbi:MAG TPA: SLBB domain-containing protein [Candidatus Krumholzibacteriaceae bacterium]|nr:SLBB domain-containing protein [Candidatus Krumholzibacteriaceae bacterium]